MKRNIWNKLVSWKDKENRLPLILKGARQVGKTYILQLFGKECFPAFHYINFEKDEKLNKIFDKDLNPVRIIQELSYYLNTHINREEDIVIFDEIQNVPRALTALKYFQEEMSSLAICAAGSLLGLHLPAGSFPVGKVEFLNMTPMSFEEFLQGVGANENIEILHNLKPDSSIPEIMHDYFWEQMKTYFIVGGLPEVVSTFREFKDDLFIAFNKVREKQNNLMLAYLADIAKHSGKQNAMNIERLWKNVPVQLAKEIDGTAKKFKFKGVVPGISRYSQLIGSIDWLFAAGLIIKVPIITTARNPISAYVTENSFKLFLFDVGLLGALSNLEPGLIFDYDYGTYKGYFAENFVAQELVSSGMRNLYCWKGRMSEVEFVTEFKGDILPIEVKSGWVTQSKSLNVFTQKYNPKFKTIMSGNNLFIDNKNKIHKYPLYLASKFPIL